MDIVGTARSAPIAWKKCSPTMSEKITSTGWSFAASPMILGFRKFASIWWMTMIHPRTKAAMPGLWVRPIATAGTELTMTPKIGMSDSTVAMSASTGQYFRPTSAKPIAVSAPLTRQMMSCPRTTPDRPRSTRASSASKSARASGRMSDVKNAMIFSRVSMRYAASMSVMPNTKIAREIEATRLPPNFTSSTAFDWRYTTLFAIASSASLLRSSLPPSGSRGVTT